MTFRQDLLNIFFIVFSNIFYFIRDWYTQGQLLQIISKFIVQVMVLSAVATFCALLPFYSCNNSLNVDAIRRFVQDFKLKFFCIMFTCIIFTAWSNANIAAVDSKTLLKYSLANFENGFWVLKMFSLRNWNHCRTVNSFIWVFFF